tara:strand:+ start:358 stop:552 length:195 start_codon:yes stop_codon:yes gene_type:complete
MFGVTRQSIYKWRLAGMPVAIDNTNNDNIKGKTIRYDLDDVMDWLNSTSKVGYISVNDPGDENE